MKKKAVVLLSGGLDSAVTLYFAKSKGYDCRCLIFDYGQRHNVELRAAKKVAERARCPAEIVSLTLPWTGSSLLDKKSALPLDRTTETIAKSGIPSTYVPARNTVFISIAASYAESIGAEKIFIGAHSEDSSGYPDCRKSYLDAFDNVIKLGTKRGQEGKLSLEFPLIGMGKKEIIKLGASLGAPLQHTWSCYSGGKRPCGTCDSCVLRNKGFAEAGMEDPAFGSGMTADISEIFSSIQGEGIYLGSKQIFVRFKDCNLSCSYCDEKNRGSSEEYTPARILKEVRALDRLKGPHHSISITGGEPLVYADFLKVFLKGLKKAGFKVYLETNGTLPRELEKVIDLVDIIAMDLKLPSSTGEAAHWAEHKEFLKTASRKRVFVKVIVSANTVDEDVEKAIRLVDGLKKGVPFILQPVTPSRKSEEPIGSVRLFSFLETGIKRGLENIRIIPQVHKVLKVK